MGNYSEKKWKYLSFALMGIIASGILAPTALAASPTLTDIFSKLVGLDSKATAIQAKTNNLPSDPASQSAVLAAINGVGGIKTIRTELHLDPSDDGFEFRDILAVEEGKAYAGHITGIITDDGFNAIRLYCDIPGAATYDFFNGGTVSNTIKINDDFACDDVKLQVVDPADEIEAGGANIYLETQYVQTSQVTDQTS
jgi:hypothetical protein